MIAVDTSTLIAYLQGEKAGDTAAFDAFLEEEAVALPSVVLTEVLCNPGLSDEQGVLLQALPTMPVKQGYWIRAAHTRRMLLEAGRKANAPDTLIAQSCLDHDIPL